MIQYYCDHCGEPMRHNNVVGVQIEQLPGHLTFEFDICDKCIDKLMKCIGHGTDKHNE